MAGIRGFLFDLIIFSHTTTHTYRCSNFPAIIFPPLLPSSARCRRWPVLLSLVSSCLDWGARLHNLCLPPVYRHVVFIFPGGPSPSLASSALLGGPTVTTPVYRLVVFIFPAGSSPALSTRYSVAPFLSLSLHFLFFSFFFLLVVVPSPCRASPSSLDSYSKLSLHGTGPQTPARLDRAVSE